MIIKLPACYDVSHWDGAINWASVSPRPLLVICKASEGNFYRDDTFAANMAGLTANGIKRGVYHFHRKANTPEAQAKYFCDTVRGIITPDDYIVLDVEEGGENAAQLKAWFQYVRTQFPNPFILYSRKNVLDLIAMTLEQAVYFKQIPTWTAGYPTNPDLFDMPPAGYIPVQTKFGRVVLWQYTETGKVNGIPAAAVDINWIAPEFVKELGGTATPPIDVLTAPHDGIIRYSGTRYGWKFELFKIDPAKVRYEVTDPPALETVSAAVKRTGATLGINGGEWDRISKPKDFSVSNSALVQYRNQPVPSLIVTDASTVLIDHKVVTANVTQALSGLRYIVTAGKPAAYLDGVEPQYTEGHARSIHGITANGLHLILQSEGAYPNQGLTLKQAAEIMLQYGAVVAFDSGGGGDVTCILDGQSLIVPENINPATGAHFERPLPQALLIYTKGIGVTNPIMPTYTIKAKADLTKVYATAAGTGQIASINVTDTVKADALGAFIHITSKNGKPLSGYVDAAKVTATPDPVVVPPPPPPDPVTPPAPAVKIDTLTIEPAAGTVFTWKFTDGSIKTETV